MYLRQAVAFEDLKKCSPRDNSAVVVELKIHVGPGLRLSRNGNPALTNFLKILDAAGLIIQVKAKRAAAA